MEVVEEIRTKKRYEIDGAKVRIGRAEKDWTKTKLAKESGVCSPTIRKIERNQLKRVNSKTIGRIAKALGKTVQDFQKNE